MNLLHWLAPDIKRVINGLGPIAHHLEGKRILLSGARGYLGKFIVGTIAELNKTLASPCQMIGLDSLLTNPDDRREEWRDVPHLTFVQHDVKHDLGNLETAFGAERKLDYVLHMAGIASPYWYQKLPLETISVAVDGSRNLLEVAKANNAKYLFFSSSEVYQTANVVPTPESYVGAIPSLTKRSSYDVSKLLGETLAYIYAGQGVHTNIVRIFNSVLGDEWLVAQDHNGLHVLRADDLAKKLGAPEGVSTLSGVRVPNIDPTTGKAGHHAATNFIRHRHLKPCLEISTRYGRKIRITGDHSVFVRGSDGEPISTRGSEIKVGDYLALAQKIDVLPSDVTSVDMIDTLERAFGAARVAIAFTGVGAILREYRPATVAGKMAAGGTYGGAHSQTSKDTRNERTNLLTLRQLGIGVPHGARVGLYSVGKHSSCPAKVELTNELLWAAGLFVAEGCFVDDGNDRAIVFSSDTESITKVTKILSRELGVHVMLTHNATGAPTARISSAPVFHLWERLGLLGTKSHDKRIPPWIMALPLSRLKFFLDGYRAGDGVHGEKGKIASRTHAFNTVSEGLKNDLIVVLGRFGLVPAVGRYNSNIKRYPGRMYPFWRVTVPRVTPWDILEWDKGAIQTMQCPRTGDIAWALVKSVRSIDPTEFVYDFSVPGPENFITGQGVMAHNSFGIGLGENDRRILPRIASAIKRRGEFTIYGHHGRLPTRTYAPVANTILGIFLVLLKGMKGEVYNVGVDSPEISVPDLCSKVEQVTGLRAKYNLEPPPSNYETEPMRRCPNIQKLRDLGFLPIVDLDEGLDRFFQWAEATYTGIM